MRTGIFTVESGEKSLKHRGKEETEEAGNGELLP
jgi:hypothetical protein